MHDPTHDEPCESKDVSPDVIGKMIPQQRKQQRIIGETVDVSVPQLREHLVEERYLLSAAYKSLADSRRAVRCVINRVKQKEKTKGNEQEATHAKGYAINLEIELQESRGISATRSSSVLRRFPRSWFLWCGPTPTTRTLRTRIPLCRRWRRLWKLHRCSTH